MCLGWASPGSLAPGARLLALRTLLGCPESAFGERAPWQWHKMGESGARERPRRSSNRVALRATSTMLLTSWGEQHPLW